MSLETIALEARHARAHGQPLPSPCVKVCRINPGTNWCEGCLRRLDEIGGWGSLTEDTKWAIWERIQQRHSKELP